MVLSKTEQFLSGFVIFWNVSNYHYYFKSVYSFVFSVFCMQGLNAEHILHAIHIEFDIYA